MIHVTNSYLRTKEEYQKIWNFAILICHSIPNLKKTIKGIEYKVPDYSLPNPDYFGETIHKDKLKKFSGHYKFNLSKYVFISLFSFFESYVKSVIDELIEFHGGENSFTDYISKKQKLFINCKNIDIEKCRKKFKNLKK